MALQQGCSKTGTASSDNDDNSSDLYESNEDSSSNCEDEFIIVSEEDQNNRDNQTHCTLENIVQLFEMILCFHAFFKNLQYWTIGDESAVYERFDQGVCPLMKQLVSMLHCGEKTNNWKTQKTHEILHFAEQICEFGHLMNADTGVGERGLKYWAKKPACSARKGYIDVFTESTTSQVVDTMILRKAYEIMNIGNQMFTCMQSHN
jgi:hypothetical protein